MPKGHLVISLILLFPSLVLAEPTYLDCKVSNGEE